ncbi:nuclease-related domain-containing protein [Pseudobacillus badius]|uniref:nuclease-related domain-containing protein n=1 Tax=Bacillus badius TaxID=1455 RepID=UPI003D34AE91
MNMAIILKERDEEQLYEGRTDTFVKQAGDLGEDIICSILEKNLSDNYLLINDLFVRTKEFDMTQLDHALIHESFILCIETKHYSGEAKALDSNTWELNGRNKNYTLNSPQLQSLTHAMHLSSFLKEYNINLPIYAAVVLVSDNRCTFNQTSDTYFREKCPVIYGKELIPFIRCIEDKCKQVNQKQDTKKVADLILSEHEGIKGSTLYQCKKAAVNENDQEALFLLGKMFIQGFFQYGDEAAVRVKKDEKAGRMYLRKAMNLGYQSARDFYREINQ